MNAWWILWAAVAAAIVWQVRRALREPLERDRIIAAARRRQGAPVHDVGPDSLRLLEDLDAHLDDYVAADLELAAGFDRLRQAIRDHREGEEQ